MRRPRRPAAAARPAFAPGVREEALGPLRGAVRMHTLHRGLHCLPAAIVEEHGEDRQLIAATRRGPNPASRNGKRRRRRSAPLHWREGCLRINYDTAGRGKAADKTPIAALQQQGTTCAGAVPGTMMPPKRTKVRSRLTSPDIDASRTYDFSGYGHRLWRVRHAARRRRQWHHGSDRVGSVVALGSGLRRAAVVVGRRCSGGGRRCGAGRHGARRHRQGSQRTPASTTGSGW